MHQSFVVQAHTGPGNSGALNFSDCKTLLDLKLRAKSIIKSLPKCPDPLGFTIVKNDT